MNAQKLKYLNVVKTSPVQFGVWAGFSDLINIHNEWIKSFLFDKEDKTLLAHRGSYKTTCLAVAIALLIVIYPNKNIIFFRKTDTDVIEIVVQVSKILQSDHFKALIWALYKVELVMIKDTSWEIDTNLKTSTRGTSQLLGLGIGASITGKHADTVITDDIVNLKDRVSRAERERTKSAYMELQNVKNRGGRFINTGTPWHKEDAITSMPNVSRFTCRDTGLMTQEEIKHLRDRMTPSLFAANYELQHIADADAMFTNPNWFNDNSLLYDGVSHIDASYGGSDGTAYTIVKQRDDDYYVIGKRWAKHVDDCVNEILLLQQKYRVGTLWSETNADKGYLANNLLDEGLTVDTYHEKDNKFIKITTHLRGSWVNIYFHEDTDPDYITEILDYTENAEHDDSPDSLASLIRIIKAPKPSIKTFRGGL